MTVGDALNRHCVLSSVGAASDVAYSLRYPTYPTAVFLSVLSGLRLTFRSSGLTALLCRITLSQPGR